MNAALGAGPPRGSCYWRGAGMAMGAGLLLVQVQVTIGLDLIDHIEAVPSLQDDRTLHGRCYISVGVLARCNGASTSVAVV